MENTTTIPLQNQEISVTNNTFLKAIFGDKWELAHVTSFKNDPSNIPQESRGKCWGGHRFGSKILHPGNQYYTVSLFDLNDGKVVRQKACFAALYVLVIDDVGEKVLLSQVEKLPPPNYIVNTSENSQQWGWIFSEPCRDFQKATNLLDGFVKLGITPDFKDPGMKGVTRYVRLPEGHNTKANRLVDGKPYKCQLIHWDPFGERYTIEQIAEAFGIDLYVKGKEVPTSDNADVNHPILDKIETKQKKAPGEYMIVCPWVDEHTGQDDSGTILYIREDLQIGFKCHHGHCHDRTGKDLLEWIEEDSPDWTKRLDAWKTYRELGVDKDIDDIEVLESIDSIVPESVRPVPPTMKEILDELLADFARLPKTEIAEEHAFKIMEIAEKCDKVAQIRAHDRIRDYLGWSIKEFKVVLKEQRAKWYVQTNTGKYKQISFSTFPDKNVSENNIRLYDTVANTRHLLKEYKITTQLDQITKENIFVVPGENSTDEATLLEMIIGLVRFHDLPQVNTLHRLFNECRANPINPVVEHLSGLDYKGVGFIQQLAEHVTVESETEHIRDQVFRMWMTMACAAADYAESTPNKEAKAKFDSIMIFVGDQGLKKTQFFQDMLPEPLRQYFDDGVSIDPTDKDSIFECIQLWVAEAGEVDSLFKKADIGKFKAFLSKRFDVLRRPYARSPSKYQRRTAFVASANDRAFLKDYTGNRRYWPLAVEKIVIPTDEDLISNAWAEAWKNYTKGETWWPDEEFEKVLSGQTMSFQMALSNDPLEESIRDLIERKTGKFLKDVVKPIDIRTRLLHKGMNEYNLEKTPSMTMIGMVMKQYDLGLKIKAGGSHFWVIRNRDKYEKMKRTDLIAYYNS